MQKQIVETTTHLQAMLDQEMARGKRTEHELHETRSQLKQAQGGLEKLVERFEAMKKFNEQAKREFENFNRFGSHLRKQLVEQPIKYAEGVRSSVLKKIAEVEEQIKQERIELRKRSLVIEADMSALKGDFEIF